MAPQAQFNPELLSLLQEWLPNGTPINTIGTGQPNWVVTVDSRGVLVETERSRDAQNGPQLVPAWMFEVAWHRLTARGLLTNAELLSNTDLNVKRSSFVCAALARLPGVTIASNRPIALAYEAPA